MKLSNNSVEYNMLNLLENRRFPIGKYEVNLSSMNFKKGKKFFFVPNNELSFCFKILRGNLACEEIVINCPINNNADVSNVSEFLNSLLSNGKIGSGEKVNFESKIEFLKNHINCLNSFLIDFDSGSDCDLNCEIKPVGF